MQNENQVTALGGHGQIQEPDGIQTIVNSAHGNSADATGMMPSINHDV
jgi:hypothetical protein